MSEYRDFAEALAYEAGEIMESGQSDNSDNRQPTTAVNRAIQDLAIDRITAAHPGHAVLGEERSHLAYNTDHTWIVDAMDGDHTYARPDDFTHPDYGYAMAKRLGRDLELGVFHHPFRSETFTAIRGLGAYLNDQRMCVNTEQFAPGTAYDYCYWDGALIDPRVLEYTLGQPQGHQSATYQACLVAKGDIAFSVFPGSLMYDIAPGAIIVEEAGGTVTDLRGRPLDWCSDLPGAVFSNGIVHQAVLNTLWE